jgi:hypothetical protein
MILYEYQWVTVVRPAFNEEKSDGRRKPVPPMAGLGRWKKEL